jgi:hypothetical protein
MPSWRRDLLRIERVADIAGHEAWLESTRFGRVVFETVECQAPNRLVLRIHHPRKAFEGTWTFVLDPAPGGARLTITESATIRHPLMRILSRIFDPRCTMTQYMMDLARHLGSQARFLD